MRVLLVDDEELVRDLFSSILAEAGYEVTVAGNGVEALEVLDARTVDLVITDILMPEKEGVETIVEIRGRHPETRIIAVSGGGRVKNLMPLEIAAKLGADLVLQKPIEPDALLEAVARVTKAASGSQAAAGGEGKP